MLLHNIGREDPPQVFSLETAARPAVVALPPVPPQEFSQVPEQKRYAQQQNPMEIEGGMGSPSNSYQEGQEGGAMKFGDVDEIKQEKFDQKEKEFRDEQLKEKRLCMKAHFKEKQIMELRKLIDQNRTTLTYFEQKKYLQATDINFSRSLLEEYNGIRDKINKCNEQLRQLEIKRWDQNTIAQNLRDLLKQEEAISSQRQQDQVKEQVLLEKKRVEDYKEQIKKVTEEIRKLKEKHLEISDNYSTIKLQLKEQIVKNNRLKKQIEDLKASQ